MPNPIVVLVRLNFFVEIVYYDFWAVSSFSGFLGVFVAINNDLAFEIVLAGDLFRVIFYTGVCDSRPIVAILFLDILFV